MNNGILVLNAGSSSLRFAVYRIGDDKTSLTLSLRGQVSGIGSKPVFSRTICKQSGDQVDSETLDAHTTDNHQEAIAIVLAWIERHSHNIQLSGAGHRVVHGGPDRHSPERIDSELVEELDALSRLAPHHQPHNLAAIQALADAKPDLPQVACFDTAFHASQGSTARRLPLPRALCEQGLQRYGFHGLSYEYITATIPAYNQERIPERLIIAHLGNGASLCAVKRGQSIASSMGFSTLDGLLMGSRCGAIDPGVLLHLMREYKMDETALSHLLYDQSGLRGVSGISGDMQVLLNSREQSAQEAIDLFCYTLQRAIGSMAAALEGVDGIVFTGGIGENASPVRAQVCESLGWLGLDFDYQANHHGHTLLSTENSPVKVWVIPTDEERVIAQHTCKLI